MLITKKFNFFHQFLLLIVTLEELKTIADKLRPYTADAMKIEVAPWIQDYVVDMDDLYTELALEKLHNKPTRQDAIMLKDYTELFRNCEPSERVHNLNLPEQESLPARKRLRTDCHKSDDEQIKSDKILMKGDPGMGKTTQCKKISWDWAMRLFAHFHIVIFVFLQFVKAGDIIENVIIKQNPFMMGLKITEQKLRSILESFGEKCLLILDGLDEHALGTNKDVLSIIRGEKYLKCNIIVTSRPHSTRDIKRYFSTVVRVEGFTREKAKQFASKILDDDKVIEAVLDYNPATEDSKGQFVPIHKCPILLSFMCLLAKEDYIDLSSTKVHTGEIYARMVQCLYKKYVIRKGLSFEFGKFQASMIAIGNLALKTLLSGDPLMRRADVIREVGTDAFDFGLLIGS